MSKRKSIFGRIVLAVIVLLLLALLIGALCKFTRVGDYVKDLFDITFRVEYDGVNYKGNNNTISLPPNKQARFNVKGANGYKVAITPNVTAETDFTYTVDGVEHKYSETNLTSVFLSQENMQSGYFELNIIENYTIESVLSKLYDGQTILIDVDLSTPYLLTITSDESKVQFVIGLGVKGVSLDIDRIVF